MSAVVKKKVVKKSTAKDSLEYRSYVPSKTVGEKYIGRKVHGVQDMTIADIATEQKKNILLMGDTGAGKTMFGEAYAAKKRMRYYSLPCDVSIDPSALFGRMQPTDTVGKFVWQDGPVTEIVRHGGVLNISEINFMPPKIGASLYPLLDSRRYIPLLGHNGEVVRAHDNLLVIADMNPNYRGTVELNAAFYNRFGFKIQWGYQDSVESKLVKSSSLMSVVKKLRAMSGTDLFTPVSTNMMMEFEEFAMNDLLGLNFAIKNFITSFQQDERNAVKRVFELVSDDLKKEIDFYKNSSEEVEEIEFDYVMD